MFRNILLPTDFSDISWNAIAYAIRLFEKEPCKFYLLHSTLMKVSTMESFTDRLAKTLIQSARNDLDNWVKRIEDQTINPEHSYETIITENHLDDSVEWAVDKYGIDLVVMATKGATGAKGVLFGSNAVRVIKSVSNCPILVVPEDFTFKRPKEIAFPTDFNREYTIKEVKPIKQIAQMFDAQIRILHINEEESLTQEQESNRVELTKFLEPVKHRFHWMPDYAKKANEIYVFIESLYLDMLAMVRYKHSVLEAIFNEPVIKKISFRTKVPFLVIPE
ncbi:MAG: universal stress protein [Flavobacteriaceae bacterium]|nr:universal stress protein [Bacteroidia bacterium]NNK87979.1 universal stress protein [Flavobacteriaceae bacterium]